MRIVFMGTPDFSVPSLEALLTAGHEIAAVVTQPDRPRGRGQKLRPSPVKKVALEHDIPVLQPEKVREEKFISRLREMAPEAIVVVAFGQIIPPEILQLPPYGCINVHASLLPKYRGAAPIQAALLAGDKKTGVSTMYMDEGLDTGDVILQRELPITGEDNAGTLHDKLAALGADLLVETLERTVAGDAPRIPQDDSLASYAPKISRDEGKIDWSASAEDVHNRIRAMNPWPGSYAFLGGRRVIVRQSAVASLKVQEESAPPGTIVSLAEGGPVVITGSGTLRLKAVQLPGRKCITGQDVINGLRLRIGDQFTSEKGSTNE